MPEETARHVTLRLEREYRFVATFDDVPAMAPVRFDEPPPLGDGSAPSASDMLGAAVANCLSASLAFCLRRAHLEVRGIEAHVTTRVGRNERGRLRVSGIDVDLTYDVVDPEGRRARCEAIFEDFCTVTGSIRQGLPISVSVKSTDAVALDARV